MFLSFYTFIIIIMIVQVTDSVDVKEYRRIEPLRNKETLQRIKHYVKHTAENKGGSEFSDEAKLFDSVQEEGSECSSPAQELPPSECKDESLDELKKILQKLLKKLNMASSPSCNKRKTSRGLNPTLQKQDLGKGRRENTVRRPRWGQWTSWSSCSVSCGKGREIRWRHCVEACDSAETEMEEKTCQLPACSPGAFFGIHL